MLQRVGGTATVLLLLAVLALHWRMGSVVFGSSLWDGDPQRHFASGVMFFDYLRSGIGSNPVQFAKDFEVRYPEVAIGHWPPMLYAVQSLFYFLAGPTIRSAQLLSVLTAVAFSLLLFWKVKPVAGLGLAALSAIVFLGLPLMQTAAWQVMSDMLTAFFVFLSIAAFSKHMEKTSDWKSAVAFAVWGSAAILTKGSAWPLGAFALLAPLLARRLSAYRSLWLWGFGIAMVAVSAPFFVLSQKLGIGYPGYYSHIASPAFSLSNRLRILLPLVEFAPALLIGLSVLGFADAIYARWVKRDEAAWTTMCIVSGSWIVAQAVFLMFLPLTSEPRALFPCLAPACLLTARSFLALQRRMPRSPMLAQGVSIVLAALILVNGGAAPVHRIDGYRDAANSVPYADNGSLILIAGVGVEEGAFVAERLSHDRSHRDVVLRGNHIFTQLDSHGQCTLLYPSASTMRDFLVQLPVRFVVIGTSLAQCPYQQALKDAILADPEDFHPVASVPITELERGQIAEFYIFENPAGLARRPAVIRTPLGLDAGGRVLEYHWQR